MPRAGANGWTLDGLRVRRRVGQHAATTTYYIASNRTYVSYDKYLQTGPYNFGFLDASPTGSSTSRTRTACSSPTGTPRRRDNNTSEHPGQGLILPIDAHPAPMYRLDGSRGGRGSRRYDAPFGLEKADSFTLHLGTGSRTTSVARTAEPVFDDNASYWDSRQPSASVKVPNNGVSIKVLSETGTSMGVKVWKRN